MSIDNYNAGMNAYDAGRYDEALEWFEKGLEADARCAFSLAVMYYNAQGVAKNYTQSTQYFAIAADAGIPPAMSSAGFAYANALGVPEDMQKAEHYLEQAVAKGELAAKVTLAEIYAKGLGKGTQQDAARMIREVLALGSNEEAMDVYSRYELHLA